MQVTVDGAGVRFGSRVVFDDFSATFPENRVTALVGPSGSGKSTLLAAIAGMQSLTAGCIRFGDEHAGSPRKSRLVSWIAQDSTVLGARTALDNVLLGPLSEGEHLEGAVSRATSALADVGLFERRFQCARTLSGGERQRVAVARALASCRPVILADEPSAALDESATHDLADVFLTLSGRATIVVATHDPVMVEASEHVVRMRGGR